MLVLKCFIFSFFLWLSFATPPHSDAIIPVLESQAEITTSSNHTDHQVSIVDSHLETNRANYSFKTFKIPYFHSNDKREQLNAETYDYKLLYFEIGNTIPLKLTSKTLIFPFHSFT